MVIKLDIKYIQVEMSFPLLNYLGCPMPGVFHTTYSGRTLGVKCQGCFTQHTQVVPMVGVFTQHTQVAPMVGV